ncbi:DUF58 domain-containing protein [Phyllobacterium leguminum]|uniref:Uncharacterized protein (DUF58 family) n=1 Tax=Phyllobacterium leguminum TaxID=314237 RepID=A0A318T374_9HYPH|nr:DUF58 domain-containing protein [Phyllobacterium leguminum]PYE87105.1 uncharacterized protein (DUF58 family) [Phyllobacterium leguminum]
MAALGALAEPALTADALARARQRAALVPDLLVEARRVANTAISGWHGRRRRGIGENFWQFRPYNQGEALSRIDWRRSARDDHTYVRDREWEAAHTVWLWADPSASMRYKSNLGEVSKEWRSLIITLALAELLSRGGERIAFPGIADPFSARNGAERLATALSHAKTMPALPDVANVRRFSDIVLVSDFLHPLEEMLALLDRLAQRGAHAHLIEIADPAEEVFPYSGRTEFSDPETGERITAGRAENYAEEYRRLYLARRETLAHHCRRLGWSFTVNRTDRPASEALMRVHMHMSGPGAAA